ncbi:type III effector phosphothreonine lyase [Trinickia caryophylli]|uniref:type III effector phosphothreonine lyase n=1 Tax=Trinickia caryophylli TaxID=28094 RepID=UPI0030EE77F9
MPPRANRLKEHMLPRPLARLDLSFLQRPAQAAVPSPSTELRSGEATLRMAMSRMPPVEFARASATPAYSTLARLEWGNESNGFTLTTDPIDVFIHASRRNGSADGQFAGDKFHLSVEPGSMNAAWDAISPLLLSADSPFDKWKITDMTRCPDHARVYRGAQFTLYAKTDTDTHYTAEHLKRIQSFVGELESALSNAGVPAGERPASDASSFQWNYASYRNEHRSDRAGSTDQHAQLAQEPFFKLTSGN